MKSLARNIIRAWVPEADDRPYLLTGIRNSPKKKVDGGERERAKERTKGGAREQSARWLLIKPSVAHQKDSLGVRFAPCKPWLAVCYGN